MVITIPSKGRAGKTKSSMFFKDAILYVPEYEYNDYKIFNENVIAVPHEIKGITKTRNFILNDCKDKYIIMIDDDVKIQGWLEVEKYQMKKRSLDYMDWICEFYKLFSICEDLNFKIWGVRTESSPRGTYPFQPFLFQSYVTASCMGIVNDGSYYFDENFEVKEDYEICLRHIKERGGILSVKYLVWENEHWYNEGGCKDYRTTEIELKCIKQLIELYPGMIRRVKRKDTEYQIQLDF